MSSLSMVIGRPTLADRLFAKSIVMDLVLIASGAALTSIAAQLVIPMWPVPITGQTFAVLLVGTTLGAVRGAASLALYLLMGVAGLPVFAAGGHGTLIGSTTGGYVVGFIFAAALTGWLAQRQWDRRVVGTFIAFTSGTAVMYLFGLPWLYAVLSGLPQATLVSAFGTDNLVVATLVGGFVPFLIGDAIKALFAAGLLPVVWKLVSQNDTHKARNS